MKAKKGIVMELKNDGAIILLPTGEYKKIRTRQYLEVGDLYEESSSGLLKAAIAAVIMLALIAGGIDYNSVQAYASLGSNLELGINRWGRVVSVKAKNSEGQKILQSVQIKNDKLETAVEKITQQTLKEGQKSTKSIKQNLKATVEDNNNQQLKEKMIKEINKGLYTARSKHDKTNNGNNIKNKIHSDSKNNSSEQDNQILNEKKSKSNQDSFTTKNKKFKHLEKKKQLENKQRPSQSGNNKKSRSKDDNQDTEADNP